MPRRPTTPRRKGNHGWSDNASATGSGENRRLDDPQALSTARRIGHTPPLSAGPTERRARPNPTSRYRRACWSAPDAPGQPEALSGLAMSWYPPRPEPWRLRHSHPPQWGVSENALVRYWDTKGWTWDSPNQRENYLQGIDLGVRSAAGSAGHRWSVRLSSRSVRRSLRTLNESWSAPAGLVNPPAG